MNVFHSEFDKQMKQNITNEQKRQYLQKKIIEKDVYFRRQKQKYEQKMIVRDIEHYERTGKHLNHNHISLFSYDCHPTVHVKEFDEKNDSSVSTRKTFAEILGKLPPQPKKSCMKH